MKTKLIIYRDKKKQFRWRMKRSGRIVAESGEGYQRLPKLTTALFNLISDLSGYPSSASTHVSTQIATAITMAEKRKFKP